MNAAIERRMTISPTQVVNRAYARAKQAGLSTQSADQIAAQVALVVSYPVTVHTLIHLIDQQIGAKRMEKTPLDIDIQVITPRELATVIRDTKRAFVYSV